MKTSAVFSLFSDSLQDAIDVFFPDGVMSSSIVISSILFPTNKLLGMEEISETSSSDFVQDSWFKINVDRSGSELPGVGLGEESCQRLLRRDFGLRDGDSVVVDSVLSTVQLPASISNLGSSLSDVDGDAFSLKQGL